MADRLTILQGDALTVLKTLPDESVQCCVTSPPYWGLRDYGVAGQLGLERTPEEYVGKMVEVFREVRRVLRGDGTLWLNIGDSYSRAPEKGGSGPGNKGNCNNGLDEARRKMVASSGTDDGFVGRARQLVGRNGASELKPKDLIGIPWRLAFALQADGWWLRQDIIWHKPNPMPESVTDRCTKAHEYIFLLTKSARYYYDAEAIKEAANPDYASRYDYDFNVGSKEANGGGRPDGASNTPGLKQFTGTRNKRSVWTVATDPYSEAHFATFPPDLIKPCILAGTSARGCCPKCGAPWERVVETVRVKDETRHSGRAAVGCEDSQDADWPRMIADSKTTGWHPTCDCGVIVSNGRVDVAIPSGDPIPCTILDPFFGSGTTGMVALELGRKCIGIELNPAYIKLAEQRCQVTPGLALA